MSDLFLQCIKLISWIVKCVIAALQVEVMKHCNESPEKAFNLKAKNMDLVWWFSEWACPE